MSDNKTMSEYRAEIEKKRKREVEKQRAEEEAAQERNNIVKNRITQEAAKRKR